MQRYWRRPFGSCALWGSCLASSKTQGRATRKTVCALAQVTSVPRLLVSTSPTDPACRAETDTMVGKHSPTPSTGDPPQILNFSKTMVLLGGNYIVILVSPFVSFRGHWKSYQEVLEVLGRFHFLSDDHCNGTGGVTIIGCQECCIKTDSALHKFWDDDQQQSWRKGKGVCM